MKACRGPISIVLVLLGLAATQACRGMAMPSNSINSDELKPQTVTYCDLIAHPERYDKKTVRIRAILDHTDFEKNNLDDVVCVIGKPPKAGPTLGRIWFIEPDTMQRAPFALFDITAVGVFYAGSTDEPTKYGNCCRFAFQITRLEASEKLK